MDASPQPYPLQCLHGLHVFPYPADDSTTFFCFAMSVAHTVGLSTSAISLHLERNMKHLKDLIVRPAGAVSTMMHQTADKKSAEAVHEFQRLRATFLTVNRAVNGLVET